MDRTAPINCSSPAAPAEYDFDPMVEATPSSKDIRHTELSPSAQMETAVDRKFELRKMRPVSRSKVICTLFIRCQED